MYISDIFLAILSWNVLVYWGS